MKNSITQTALDDNQIFKTMRNFFKKYRIGSIMKEANGCKMKGFPAIDVFRYLFTTVFLNRSAYMDMLCGRSGVAFGKDTAYRLLNNPRINWMKFTTLLASGIISQSIEHLTGDERANVLIVDDSVFSRSRSKKVEMLTKVFDHANMRYLYGFRMLTLAWSDGNTLMPVNSVLMSSEKPQKRMNERQGMDRRSLAYKRRVLSVRRATETMVDLIKAANKAAIPAKYVLFDSWFSSPKTIHAVKGTGYEVIAMVKKSPKTKFVYEGEKLPLAEIYKNCRKRRGRSKYLLSVEIGVEKDGNVLPARVVYVRNRSNRKDYLCIISTDVGIDEDEIIRIYSKRWKIEVFFKVCKSYLKLEKGCRSLSYDAMTAHTAVVFTRYMMLSLENRQSEDPRSWGEIFLYLVDEMADASLLQAFGLLMQLFAETLQEALELSEKTVSDLVDSFMAKIPAVLKRRLGFA